MPRLRRALTEAGHCDVESSALSRVRWNLHDIGPLSGSTWVDMSTLARAVLSGAQSGAPPDHTPCDLDRKGPPLCLRVAPRPRAGLDTSLPDFVSVRPPQGRDRPSRRSRQRVTDRCVQLRTKQDGGVSLGEMKSARGGSRVCAPERDRDPCALGWPDVGAEVKRHAVATDRAA